MKILLLLAASLALGACQGKTNPQQWTLEEVHQEVGLSGGHQQMACGACHAAGTFAGVEAPCESCHLEDFAATTAPNHREAGYGTMCATCHVSTAWQPAGVDHERFGFALEGAHALLACAACHTGGQFTSLPSACVDCHRPAYAAAQPDHRALQFSTACVDCHGQAAWRPARFDHQSTGFALVGAHATTACQGCHAGGVFAGVAQDCFSCHRADEPANHFGPACAACHTSAAWQPATFDHERFFPIQRGEHRRYRSDCSACHPSAGDYHPFTCTDCHDGTHSQPRMDRKHLGEVRNYRYESAACFECHSRGRGEDD